MCGSYSIVPGDKFYQRFAPVNRLVILKPNYNVKPGYMMPVITGNRLSFMKWGLIPSWAKDPAIGYKLERETEEKWLEEPADMSKLISLLKPFPENKMEAYPVSRAVNYGENDSEELIKPVKENKQPSLF